MNRDIPNTNCIGLFINCLKCLEEAPDGTSSALIVGQTVFGIQVWCSKHDCNVCHIDFQGQMHPANLTVATPLSSEVDNVIHVDFKKKSP